MTSSKIHRCSLLLLLLIESAVVDQPGLHFRHEEGARRRSTSDEALTAQPRVEQALADERAVHEQAARSQLLLLAGCGQQRPAQLAFELISRADTSGAVRRAGPQSMLQIRNWSPAPSAGGDCLTIHDLPSGLGHCMASADSRTVSSELQGERSPSRLQRF